MLWISEILLHDKVEQVPQLLTVQKSYSATYFVFFIKEKYVLFFSAILFF